MPAKITFEKYVAICSEIHGGKYTYDEESYEQSFKDKGKMRLTCPVHGPIHQNRIQHKNGVDCRACSYKNRNTNPPKKDLSEMVIEMFYLGHRYKYDLDSFVSMNKNMRVRCPVHGWFKQRLDNQQGGKGCPECAKYINGLRKKRSWSDFVIQSFYLGHRYRYNHKTYSGHVTKPIEMECPVHGNFKQSMTVHLMGCGCPLCGGARGSHRHGRGIVENSRENFLTRVNKGNPGLKVLSQYKGIRELITVKCRYGHVTETIAENIAGRRGTEFHCTTCKGEWGVSQPELRLRELIEALGLVGVYNNRAILKGKELDLYIPEKSIALEYNGSIWHSEKFKYKDKFHMNAKRLACEALGVRLINIYSSDPPKAVMNTLINTLDGAESYDARKCRVGSVASNDSRVVKLYNDNHIQGPVRGCISYCLYFNDQVVAAMSFSSVTSIRGEEKDESKQELRRYASYGRVRGGAGRLLHHFLKDHPECREVISYSDNRYFQGGMYSSLGFDLVKEANPDYAYTNDAGAVLHKSKFKRSEMAKRPGFDFKPEETERENCWRNRWYRIWDCGKKKWVLTI